MRPQLVEFPEAARLQPDVPVHRQFRFAEAVVAREKSNLGIEVVADFGVAGAQPPLFGVVRRADVERVLVARQARRLRPRDESIDEAVLPEPHAGIGGIAAVVIAIAGEVAGRLAVHEDGADR